MSSKDQEAMKITKLLKPVALGAGVTIATELLAPEYVTFAGIGSGLYILYKFTRKSDEKPYAIGVEYDKESNKFIAAIKNPSNKPYAIKTQIRLRPEIKAPEGMMTAGVIPDLTTLIAEIDEPIIIGPNETITISNDLLMSKEALDSMDGMLRVAISFEDLKKSVLKSSETKAASKIDNALAKIKDKIKSKEKEKPAEIAKSSVVPESALGPVDMNDALIITQPIQFDEELDSDTQLRCAQSSSEMLTFNDALIFTYPLQYEVTLYGGEEVIPLKSPFVPLDWKKRNGHYIGYSKTMLRIIAKMDAFRTKLNSGDAI